MKKVLLFSSVIIILGLTGCSNKYFNDWFSSEQNETDKICQQVIEAYKQQDSEKLKSLFSEESKKNIENLDTEISAFFDYIEGSIQSLRAIVHHQVKATMVKGKRNWMVCISY